MAGTDGGLAMDKFPRAADGEGVLVQALSVTMDGVRSPLVRSANTCATCPLTLSPMLDKVSILPEAPKNFSPISLASILNF